MTDNQGRSERPLGPQARKRIVVQVLIERAGDLAEFWSELGDSRVSYPEARNTLAHLLRRMPGEFWDDRLGPPPAKG